MMIISKKTPSSLPAESLDDLIAQIAETETFRSAPMMRSLLAYLWKNRGQAVTEYAVGIDALGKSTDFDPRTDSSVRVQISRLRAKLKEFYEASGDTFPLKLAIPMGRHDLQWTYEQPAVAAEVRSRTVPRVYATAAVTMFGAVSILCLLLFMRLRALEASPSLTAAPLPRFWHSFLSRSKPVEIVIPSPVYFFWRDRGLNVRDLSVSEFPKWPSSPLLSELAAKWGPPQLSQNYVGVPEMNAGIRLIQFLHGRTEQLEVIESRKFAADSVAARNTIFLGMPRTAAYLDSISQKLDFYIERVEPDLIRNRRPRPGEPAEFRQIDYSADRIRYPGIIALLPARPEGTRSLLLLGRSPLSMATMLTSTDGLRLTDEEWKKNGSPDAWAMVVECDIYRGDTVAGMAPVSFHAIPPDFWK